MPKHEVAARVLEEFGRDGSLRDIYAFGTNAEDWVSMANHLVDYGYDRELRFTIGKLRRQFWRTLQMTRTLFQLPS